MRRISVQRRQFLLAAGALLAAPPCGFAQIPTKLPRVALVDSVEQPSKMVEGHFYWGELLGELPRLGYAEGKSIVLDRWSGGGETASGYKPLAQKVVASRADLIVARGRTVLAPIAAATKIIPIVAIGSIPPDLRASLARPGGNVTGIQVSADDQQIYVKQAEFLRDVTRKGARIAWLGTQIIWDSIVGEASRNCAKQVGLQLQPHFIGSPFDEAMIRRAFAEIVATKPDGLLQAPSTEVFPFRRLVSELALAARLPGIGAARVYPEEGLLMSYGAEPSVLWRRAAHYVDRILKGTPPGDIPIEQPYTIELVINLKTAKAIGVKVPQTLVLRADRVIE